MTTQERAEVIQAMAENMNAASDPKVGIFWYDEKSHELFGVNSAMAGELNFNANHKKTLRLLHKDYWQKQYHRGNKKFAGDYTQIPRGRVFEFEGQGFKVMVGNWINDFPKAHAMILDEFDLPQDAEFIIDSHWDLGHGWSEEFI